MFLCWISRLLFNMWKEVGDWKTLISFCNQNAYSRFLFLYTFLRRWRLNSIHVSVKSEFLRPHNHLIDACVFSITRNGSCRFNSLATLNNPTITNILNIFWSFTDHRHQRMDTCAIWISVSSWLFNKNLPVRLISKQTSTREWQLIPQRACRKSYFPSQEKKGRTRVVQRKVQCSRTDRKQWHMATESKGNVEALFNCLSSQNPQSLSNVVLWP